MLGVCTVSCWDAGKVGQGLLDGHHHGCMTYTHTIGSRPRQLEFSNGVYA
jgi:hypothetical protein